MDGSKIRCHWQRVGSKAVLGHTLIRLSLIISKQEVEVDGKTK